MSAATEPCGGGNRRRFLQTTAAAGVAALAAPVPTRGAPLVDDPPVPLVKLGKTGAEVTKLGMGTSWSLAPSFVQAAINAGVRYIDTAESYESTVSEQTLGQVIDRMKVRKDLFIVTKNSAYRKATGAGAVKVFEEHLDASLERLKTDYADAYYIHGIEGSQIGLLEDPGIKGAFEALKKAGKIRFAGISCHDAMLPELLTKAAEVGWIDQVMIQYNFRVVDHDKLQRAIDAAAKANLGMVAMKTQRGAESFPDKINALVAKGFKKEVAAIKAAWQDDRMQVVVSEMTNRSDLRENIAASRAELTVQEARLLEEYRRTTAHRYCHGCGHLCETAAKGVPVATVLRYLRYYECYGKRGQARALYAALPPTARALVDADLHAAEVACPHGLPVAELVGMAARKLG